MVQIENVVKYEVENIPTFCMTVSERRSIVMHNISFKFLTLCSNVNAMHPLLCKFPPEMIGERQDVATNGLRGLSFNNRLLFISIVKIAAVHLFAYLFVCLFIHFLIYFNNQ